MQEKAEALAKLPYERDLEDNSCHYININTKIKIETIVHVRFSNLYLDPPSPVCTNESSK